MFEKLEKEENSCGPNYGAVRWAGWFETEDEAKELVKSNSCDLCETCYRFAVIEEIPYGLYPISHNRTWWKYKGTKENVYEQIEEPAFMNMWLNSLGP